MENFNVNFEFVDNLGKDTIARAERRWNGVHIVVSKSKYHKLSDEEKIFTLTHELSHAIAQFALG